MRALFADLPEAIDNTLVIARRCAYMPAARKPILPPFAAEDGASEADELRRRGRSAGSRPCTWRGRLAPGDDAKTYRERLDFELDVIVQMGFAGYFLIVADFIQWAKAAGHSGRAGPRLGRRLGRRLVADASPISIRCAGACCSSASSIPSACRCRTSTSISARTGATR